VNRDRDGKYLYHYPCNAFIQEESYSPLGTDVHHANFDIGQRFAGLGKLEAGIPTRLHHNGSGSSICSSDKQTAPHVACRILREHVPRRVTSTISFSPRLQCTHMRTERTDSSSNLHITSLLLMASSLTSRCKPPCGSYLNISWRIISTALALFFAKSANYATLLRVLEPKASLGL
jgi:hypothetical protein